jgi:hypothetical protein
MTPTPMRTFTLQTWDKEQLVDETPGLDLASAREIAYAHAMLLGYVCRILENGQDYCEVYTQHGARKGTLGETTIVKVSA